MSYIGNEPIVSATRTITEITATAGQTVFVANGGYTVGYIDVFVNGAQLQTSDFTATNGSSITLNSGATTGDDIRLVAWGTFTTSSSYTQAATDALLATKANTTYVDGRLNTTFAFKNRIINGDMRIDQRNAGGSVTPTGAAYLTDRWQLIPSVASKLSFQQNAGAVTLPTGFTNYLGATSLSAYSITATDYFLLTHKIEGFNVADLGWGTASAQTVSMSFRVRSSLTGTFGGVIRNNAGDRVYPFTYTISAANTWESKTLTISGSTSGTWLTNNGIGLEIDFGLGVGSTYSQPAGSWTTGGLGATGATSVVGTSGATFYLTGVQLEVGASATPFDTRAYGTELALCQRYFEKSYNTETAVAASTNDGAQVFNGSCDGSGVCYISYPFKVSKRSNPTITTYTTGGGSGSWGYARSGASGNGAANVGFQGNNSFFVSITTGGSWVPIQVNGHWIASAEL